MILFRNFGDNVHPCATPGGSWQVEYYHDDPAKARGFPAGLAWVTAPEGGRPCLISVLVADGEQREGVGGELLRACRQRWPDVEVAPAPVSRPPVPATAGEPPAEARDPLRKLVDSALVVALVSGVCFAAGWLVRVRDAERLGMPAHLMPEVSTEALLLSGALHTVQLLGVVLLCYLLVRLVGHLAPDFTGRVCEGALTRFRRERAFYVVAGVFAALVIFFSSVAWMPELGLWSYSDPHLPPVKQLLLKHPVPALDKNNLRYLTNRDGLLVLKRTDRNEYVVIRDENVAMLLLGPSE